MGHGTLFPVVNGDRVRLHDKDDRNYCFELSKESALQLLEQLRAPSTGGESQDTGRFNVWKGDGQGSVDVSIPAGEIEGFKLELERILSPRPTTPLLEPDGS